MIALQITLNGPLDEKNIVAFEVYFSMCHRQIIFKGHP